MGGHDVGDLADFESLPRHVALALPIACLATLMLLLWIGARRKRARARGSSADAIGAVSAPIARTGAMPLYEGGPSVAQPLDPKRRQADAQRKIDTADERADGPRLAALYLELAAALHDEGDASARMTALRSAAGLAAKHGPARDHAKARLELAETALAAGDLTSACEHWQMARTSLTESGAAEEASKLDQRMRANGCPTDWVLTDF